MKNLSDFERRIIEIDIEIDIVKRNTLKFEDFDNEYLEHLYSEKVKIINSMQS